jgi:subtilisin family serine protease
MRTSVLLPPSSVCSRLLLGFCLIALFGLGSGCGESSPSAPTDPVSGTTAQLGVDGEPPAPPPMSSGGVVVPGRPSGPASGASGPARVIVKLRSALDQGMARATDLDAGSVNIAAAGAASPALASLIGRHGVRAAAPLYAARLRVKAGQGVSDAQIAARTRQSFAARAARAPANASAPDLGGTYVFDLGVRSRADVTQALAALSADPDVVYAEEDKPVKVAFVPNDARYSELYAMPNIGAPQAWDTARGSGVVVAVVDTGVDYNHPDIANNVWINPGEIAGNGIDDDHDGRVDDWRGWDFIGQFASQPTEDNDPMDGYGHGTHVAGTIAATGDNAIGVVGVAFGAKVMMLKGFDDSAISSDSSLANAVVYAADHGADVINASWGGLGTSQTIQNAVDYAHSLGAVFVAAAGNDNIDASNFYPANFPNAIAVAAVDRFDQKASFSNYGNKIDVAAPGMEILSLEKGTGGYITQQGTSMAAPHVSGVAALVVGLHPTFSNEQIRQVLRSSAVDLGNVGKDKFFGYGRVSASGAALAPAPLEAKFYAPLDGAAVHALTPLVGSAQGPGFASYTVDFGEGENPISWTVIQSGTSPVNNGSLGTFNPTTLHDSGFTVRLRVFDGTGHVYSDQIRIWVRYVDITSPTKSPLPVFTDVVKSGVPIDIVGRATGPSFQSFKIEWAPGRDVGTGWSSSGIVLTGNGAAPIDGAVLGRWTPPASASGEYSIHVVVTNSGFTSESRTNVYLEPDLVSTNWPRFVDATGSGGFGVTPARMANGATRLVTCGWINTAGTPCWSFSADGSAVNAVQLDIGSQGAGPSAGNLDGLPGDEVLIPDHRRLRIVSPDLVPVREIVTPREESFSNGRVSLADLDGDGTMEIVALVRDTVAGAGLWFRWSGTLQVYRADGTLYSASYPIPLTSPRMPNGIGAEDAIAVDLDGDGDKEVLVAFSDRDYTVYDIWAWNADGTPYAAWPTLSFPINGGMDRLVAADLDHDGSPEILIGEYVSGDWQLRVLNHDGTTRAGWPVRGISSGAVAIGDIDRDQREEIVTVLPGQGLSVRRPDGTVYAGSWPPAVNLGVPVIADVDNDSFPDIVADTHTLAATNGVFWMDHRLRAVSHTGGLIKEWRLFGVNGRQGLVGTPAVGDFTGDGKTDIALPYPLVEGGGINGWLVNGALTVLSNGASFNAAGADWPSPTHDPQNSRLRIPPGVSSVHLSPTADAYVRDGTYATQNFGTATSLVVKSTSSVGTNRTSYLRFPLTGVSGNVSSAKLRLYGSRTAATAVTDSAYAVTNNTWTETGINWNNRPALGAKQGAGVNVTTAAQYYEWDVTSFVTAQKAAGATTVNLAVQMDTLVTDAPDTFNSREAGTNAPDLVVETAINQPPTVAEPASALPNPTTDSTTIVSVLGADDGGEAALTYTWSVVGSPPGPVLITTNGNNDAKRTLLTFQVAGTYDMKVDIRDAGGLTVSSSVSVVVAQRPSFIAVTPATATVAPGGTVQFTASVRDQFGAAVVPQPAVSWTVSGGGTISATGLFTAGPTSGGPFTVTPSSGSVFGAAEVTVASGTTVTLAPAADAYVRDGTYAGTNFGTATTVVVKNSASAGTNRISYVRFPLTSVNGTVNSAKLRLYGSRPAATTVTDSAYAVSSNSWTETGITWNNKPAVGAKQGTGIVITTTAGYQEWDVTSFVKSQKAAGATAVSLAVQMDAPVTDSPDTFNSREAASNRPQLVVNAATGQPTTVNLSAAADAYVRDGTYAPTNFGTATALQVKTTSAVNNNRTSFLRFALTGVGASVTSAKLRLYGNRAAATTATDSAFAVSSNSWTETGITWNNQPALGAKQGASVTIGTTAQYYEWDVTAFVQAQKAAGVTSVSLAVKMDVQVNDAPDTFNAREATANQPVLMVTSAP